MKTGCLFFPVALLTIVQAVDQARLHRSAEAAELASAEQASKEIVATQVRKQGYRCERAVSADRDVEHAKTQRGWILRCEDATYHIHLDPHRAAHVERVK